ncbi:MAG: MaoC/PaaZ C-terminal domain-containing protein [Acidimicrobiia bacterium]|nr:MaoC/PaaZ C-terminal domain-containing protein [Acidimicrobiia bacterium]
MPIDVERALGARIEGPGYTWSEDDIILYNLALGAGSEPTNGDELRYVLEGELQAVPTFGTVPPFQLFVNMMSVDGLDVSLAQVLHGTQELLVHKPVPLAGTVTQEGRLTGIYDKGSGALVVFEVVSTLAETGEDIFTNRSSIFVRGEGGFGGDRGPSQVVEAPSRPPDHAVESPTLPQQALLYRLASGDRNPLHADPAFAAAAGYPRPILHGLCTYGIVGKVVVDTALGGDAQQFESFRARFSGHVFPGETIRTSVWNTEGGFAVEAQVVEREEVVVSGAFVGIRP